MAFDGTVQDRLLRSWVFRNHPSVWRCRDLWHAYAVGGVVGVLPEVIPRGNDSGEFLAAADQCLPVDRLLGIFLPCRHVVKSGLWKATVGDRRS